MSDVLSWKDLREALAGHADEYRLNEKIFSKLEGWSWPLFGAAEESFESCFGSYNYLGDVEVATQAVIEMCRSLVWQDEEYEPKIKLTFNRGQWTSLVEISQAHMEAASGGAAQVDLAMTGQDTKAGAAIMKAAVEIRYIAEQAKENAAALEAQGEKDDIPTP